MRRILQLAVPMSQAQQDSYAKHKPDQAEALREFATDHDSIVTVLKFALLSFLSQDISTSIHLLVVWLSFFTLCCYYQCRRAVLCGMCCPKAFSSHPYAVPGCALQFAGVLEVQALFRS